MLSLSWDSLRVFQLSEWRRRASAFHEHAKTVGRLLQKMVAIHNRALLYDVYNYINDINSTFNLCSKYLQWLGKGISLGFGDVFFEVIFQTIRTSAHPCSCPAMLNRGRFEVVSPENSSCVLAHRLYPIEISFDAIEHSSTGRLPSDDQVRLQCIVEHLLHPTTGVH